MNAWSWRDGDTQGAERLSSNALLLQCNTTTTQWCRHGNTLYYTDVFLVQLNVLRNSPMPEFPPVMRTTLSEKSRPCRISRAAVFPSQRFGFSTTSSTVKACRGSKQVVRLFMWLEITQNISCYNKEFIHDLDRLVYSVRP